MRMYYSQMFIVGINQDAGCIILLYSSKRLPQPFMLKSMEVSGYKRDKEKSALTASWNSLILS